MGEKKAPSGDKEKQGGQVGQGDTRTGSAGKKPKESVVNPDTSVLENYSPTGGAQSHPDWVKTRFPTYLETHGKHEATSVREMTHNGHTVRIVTTYRVEVDGEPADMHLSVDEDGQVFTHATPFVTYSSAVDLMKEVMDAYPDAFSREDEQPDHDHDHDGHAERDEENEEEEGEGGRQP